MDNYSENNNNNKNTNSKNNSFVPLLQPLMNGKKERRRPKEPWKGEFVKSIVYAGLDAIVTSFSLISSISAGRLSSVDVLVLGFANLVADGISMGFGDFVSSSTERDVANRERSVAEWDVENHRRIQQQELVSHYLALGMNADDAASVVSVFAKYPHILVDEKLMTPPDETDKPWKSGIVTFGAFMAFGCAPILAFIILIPFTNNDKVKFAGACVLSALALVLLGVLKAKIAGQNYAVSMGITLLNGAIAGGAAYGIGWTLRNVAGLEE
ncbi:vacuolar iron family transporter [Striga asiatica]|uniref:Vacuolar iron transporter n=1 Tax=Striga asiatica TaxID=4170 RepID=A0A5A7RK20_STRAF|nr:vacuolar iron family transporter [Striga asiatica]